MTRAPKPKVDWSIKPEVYRPIRNFRRYKISNWGNILDPDGNKVETFYNKYDEVCVHMELWDMVADAPVWFHILWSYYDGSLEDVYFEYVDGDPSNLYFENLIPSWKDKQGHVHHLYGRPTYFDRIMLDKRIKYLGKKIMVVETGDLFDSVEETANAIGGYKNMIYKVLKGTATSHHGYTFKYVDEQ